MVQPDLFTDFAEAVSRPGARRELWTWAALAMVSLAVAGVSALLLALSRVPGLDGYLPWPEDFFHKGLVIHVVFSFVVWFLAVFGGLLQLAAARAGNGMPRLDGLGRVATWGVAAACVLLFAPALMDRGEATLNNYIPVIIDPLYYGGLAVLGVSLVLPILRLLANLPGNARIFEPATFAMAVAGLTFLAALACIAMALAALGNAEPDLHFNEDLFWGGGHVLQYGNSILLLGAWYILAGGAISATLHRVAVLLLGALALPAIWITAEYGVAAQEYRDLFIDLQYGLGPPVLIAACGFAMALRKPFPWKDPAFLCLVLSFAVFGVGAGLGPFVDGADTRTPAHYHGVIGGINLAFMGLFYVLFLPALGRVVRRGKMLYWQIGLYAAGQFLACVGLFWAGGYGAPRKTAGAAQGLEEIGAIIGMYLNGIGALIAVIGGVMFIATAASALLRKPG